MRYITLAYFEWKKNKSARIMNVKLVLYYSFIIFIILNKTHNGLHVLVVKINGKMQLISSLL